MSERNFTVVIVGAGHGGFQLAASLRQEGSTARIVLIGEEPGLPYQRPPLSKVYLIERNQFALLLRKDNFFTDNQIELRSGTKVTRIDRAARNVTTLSGETIAYDHLVLATGARTVVPPIPGLAGSKAHYLRTLAEADAIAATLREVEHTVVIGGGFIGLEFAAVARSLGVDVTVVEATNRIMSRVVSPEVSDHYRMLHEEMGTAIETGVTVNILSASSKEVAYCVELSDGRSLACDMVLVAAGVRPNTELAEAAGLETDNGIIVDNQLLTSDPNISALGDCAAFPVPGGDGRIRLESVQAATDHARTIARRLQGQVVSYAAVPWFWSDQAGYKLQIAGLGGAADESRLVRGANGALSVYRFTGGALSCVETVNCPGDHMAARKLLSRTQRPSLSEVEAVGYALKSLL